MNEQTKELVDRIVAMLTKMGQRGYAVREVGVRYAEKTDPDTDSDPDTE